MMDAGISALYDETFDLIDRYRTLMITAFYGNCDFMMTLRHYQNNVMFSQSAICPINKLFRRLDNDAWVIRHNPLYCGHESL
jgi:hypothetical protein